MTKDLNKGISSISYNSLNLPRIVDIKNMNAEGRNEYTYSASGQKLRAVQKWNPNYNTAPVIGLDVNVSTLTNSSTTDYVGNIIYENNTLKRILVDGGYYESGNYYFYVNDHLGNNRVVTNAAASVVQSTQYYPFGSSFADVSGTSTQPYKYNGKELDGRNGLNMYDYGARWKFDWYLPMPDPLAEIYYSISPYAYCNNNPLRFIDPTGMAYTSSDPNQIGNMLDYLNNGGSVKDYDYNGWEETADPEPPQDGWPTSPFANTNYHLVDAEQKRMDAAAQIPGKLAENTRKAGKAFIKSKILDKLYTWAILSGTHAISVKAGGGFAYGFAEGGSYELILILQGPHKGSFVATKNRSRGIGAVYVSLDATATTYTFDGKLTDLKPKAFSGGSALIEGGGKFIGGASVGLSRAPVDGGYLYSRSVSFGLGLGVSVSFQIEQSEIIDL